VAIYLAVISSQGDTPAYWFLAALAAAGLCALATAVTAGARPLVANVIILALCAVAGLLSVGILLVPAIVAAAMGLSFASRSRQP